MDIGIPVGFKLGVVQESSDSFFAAVAQGLNQIRPREENYSAKWLRMICKEFASAQYSENSWLTNCLELENETLHYYTTYIENSPKNSQKRQNQNYVICGRPRVEGRIICQVFDVEIHIIENHEPDLCQEENPSFELQQHKYSAAAPIAEKAFRIDQIITGLGSRYLDEISCYSDDTVHLLKDDDLHFRPILRLNSKNLEDSLDEPTNHSKKTIADAPLHLHGTEAVYVKVYEDLTVDNFVDALTDVSRCNRMFAISGIGQNEENELVNFLRVEDSQIASKIMRKFRDGSVTFLPTESKKVAIERFRRLCQKKKDKVIYWVELASRQRIQLLWVYDALFYLPRRFLDSYDEDQLCKETDRKVKVLAYKAGMSTTVASLASQMTDHTWVIMVDIGDCVTALENIPANKRFLNLSQEDLYELLSQVRSTGFPNDDLKETFLRRMQKETLDQPPILIIFNGFCIYQRCYTEEDKMIELVLFLKQRTSAKVWVVAPRNDEMYLEEHLSIDAIQFTDFSLEEVAEYLRNFWTVRFRLMFPDEVIENVLMKYSEDLIAQAVCSSSVNSLHLSAAPSALRLFAEGLQSEVFKLCKVQDGTDPEFRFITLTDVIQRFIDERYRVAYRGKSWWCEPQLPYCDFASDLDVFHQRLAYIAHFRKNPVDTPLPFINTYTLLEEVGIIKSLPGEFRPHFVHNVFMLYFNAAGIVSNLKDDDSNMRKMKTISALNTFQSCREVIEDFTIHLLVKVSDELVAALGGNLNKVAAEILGDNHVTPIDKLGRTALHLASLGGHYNIVAILLSAGYNAFQLGAFGRSPLHYAAMHGHRHVVNLLSNYNADIDVPALTFRTTLPSDTKIADSRRTASSLVKWVNKEDCNGKSSLHYATENKHWSTACMLILNGAYIWNVSTEAKKNLVKFILNNPLEQYYPLHILLFAHVPNEINKLSRKCHGYLAWQACKSIVGEDYIASLSFAFRQGQVCLGVIDAIFGRITSGTVKSEIFDRIGASVDLLNNINESGELNDREHLRAAEHIMLYHKEKMRSNQTIDMNFASAARQGHIETLKYYIHRLQMKWNYMYTLEVAIGANQFYVVDYLCQHRKRSIEPYGPHYNTALHCAAAKGRLKTVKYLVDHRANVNANNALGETPLYHAADSHNLDVVRYLVASGSRLDVSDYCSRTSHRQFNVKDEDNVVRYFLEEYLPEFGNQEQMKFTDVITLLQLDVNELDADGRTPLLRAAETLTPTVVCHLIARGASVNFKSLEGETALHLALINEMDNGAIAKILLENGAVYDRKMHRRYVDICNNASTVRLLKSVNRVFAETTRKTLLLDGIDHDHMAAVFNARDSDMNTILHLACDARQMDIVEFILENDQSSCLNAVNQWLESPLHIASQRGYAEIVDYLLQKGAIFDSHNLQGDTPKDVAMQFSHKNVLELLQFAKDLFAASVHNDKPHVENGIQEKGYVNLKDKNGKTMLHWAAQHGYKDMAELLLHYGADANAVDVRAWTPLHYAAKYGRQEVYGVLLQHGAMVDALNCDRMTAEQLDDSLSCATLKLASSLFNYIADGYTSKVLTILKNMRGECMRAIINTHDSEGNTLLHACLREAARGCYWDLAQFLLKNQLTYDAKNHKGETPETICPLPYAKQVLKFIGEVFSWKRKLVLTLQSFEERPGSLEVIVNARDVEGKSLLHTAAKVQPIDYFRLKFFVKHGADVNAMDAKGCTVLEYAIHNGNLDLVMFLLQNGVNVLHVPNDTREELFRIADYDSKDIISLFKTLENNQKK